MEYQGIAAASGYGLGTVFLLEDQEGKVIRLAISQNDVASEIARFEEEVWQASRELEALCEATRKKLGDDAAAIFSAHMMILEDPEYISGIKEKIVLGINAEVAVQEVTDQFVALFEGMDNEYLRERAADLKDISRRLLRRLLGLKTISLADIADRVILCAHDLTPSDTAQLNRDKIVGFATDIGGRTSHSAIMARSMGIPAVVGLKDIAQKVKSGDFVIVDGNEGKVLVNPPEAIIQAYREKKEKFVTRQLEFAKLLNEKSITSDGVQVELVANIGNPKDAKTAIADGAEGVGLYRTEFLYMGRNELPGEEEQFNAYKEVASLFGATRPVVIRTLDIGGDKKLPYLDMPKEMNPFLGYRAIRLCLDRPEIFKTQLRAILRASVFGNIKMMYPMIATLQELRAANRILAEVKQELVRENVCFNPDMEVGIMVEIPAVAALADKFAKEVDFFSIGTNDLVQYTLAVDRMSEKVSYLYQPLNPSVLRLVHGVISAAHNENKWVGMCGEMAGDLTAIPILLGMGLDEFSMSASSILAAKALVCHLSQKDAASMAQAILKMDNAEKIKNYIEQQVPFIADLR